MNNRISILIFILTLIAVYGYHQTILGHECQRAKYY